MKLKKTKLILDAVSGNVELLATLIEHFQYSVKDIQSWDELTVEEKEICPKEVFEKYTS